ncbi:MAG: branched-chain amino acid aminotransferase [Clostridiales bacterium]|jgi:branched-chain amino acid aminotransferase|nr:branched-chain amino acid aminotransferase [Clostridiales bacterium]
MEMTIELSKSRKPKPADDTLTFGKVFTDHMFVMDYSGGEWRDARIAPYGPIPFDPACMVFHYGQSVFEGLKAYRAKNGDILLFRPRKNFERLNSSDERMIIPRIDVDTALDALIELLKIERDWIPRAAGTSLYIRPFVIATDAGLGVHPSATYKFMIILSPVGAYYKEGLNPVRIYVEDEYVRAVRGGIGYTKASANYASSLAGQVKAERLGYTQVLWLDGVERKYVEEVGTMNAFFKISGELVTPLLAGSILPGVTRDSVIRLAKHWGVPVSERRITADELLTAAKDGSLEEAFGSGTAAVISPIGELNFGGQKIDVSGGRTGALSKRLYDELTAIQYGNAPDIFNWVTRVRNFADPGEIS